MFFLLVATSSPWSDRTGRVFLSLSDGLARAEARGDSDADHARRVGGRCFRRRIHHRLLSDDDACIRRWSRAYYADHCAQLALLQSPPLEVVGSERSGASSEATGELCCRFFQEESSKAQVGVSILAPMSMSLGLMLFEFYLRSHVVAVPYAFRDVVSKQL